MVIIAYWLKAVFPKNYKEKQILPTNYHVEIKFIYLNVINKKSVIFWNMYV